MMKSTGVVLVALLCFGGMSGCVIRSADPNARSTPSKAKPSPKANTGDNDGPGAGTSKTDPVPTAAHGAPDKPAPLAAKATRKSPTKVTPPAKEKKPITLPGNEAEREKEYSAKEKKINAALAKQLKDQRAAIAKKKNHYRVGVTSVLGKKLNHITGLAPTDPKTAAEAKTARAKFKNKYNFIHATLKARSTPPPKAPPPSHQQRDADEEKPVRGTESQPIVGSGENGTFPSSAFPSVGAAAFSWHEKMTPVKNQGQCGSCWSFSAAGAFEGTYSIMHKQQIDLAEQFLVNCVPLFPGNTSNCDGNTPSNVWKYLTNTGATTEDKIGYTAKYGSCNSSLAGNFKVQSWGFASENNPSKPSVSEIKAALVTHGPLASSVNATDDFMNYTGGIFDEGASGSPNHAIVIAGWDDSKHSWLMRNSWGPDWGVNGYMWIDYDTNAIGSWTSWVEVTPPAAPAGKQITYNDRYLSVKNDTGEKINVTVFADTYENNSYKWVPADPSTNKGITVAVDAGQTLALKRPDNNKYLRSHVARIWADSLDGKRHWNVNKDKDLVVTPQAYKNKFRERFVHVFAKQASGQPSADQVLSEAAGLKQAGKYSQARDKYQFFNDHFGSDPRVHEARFWIGWTLFKEDRNWDSIWEFYDMIDDAPSNHGFVPYAFYYEGMAYAELGYCGYAVRAFEVPAYGETGISDEWENAAKNNIAVLQNDDGKICDNWD